MMASDDRIVDKLRKIQSLFERAATPGERAAASAAIDRILRDAPADLRGHSSTTRPSPTPPPSEPAIEFRFSFDNPWSRMLFLALLRKHGLNPFRRPRLKHTTVMARVRKSFCDEVLWPEFVELNKELSFYLDQTAREIIEKAVNPDCSDPE
jgi:hypothetical protein